MDGSIAVWEVQNEHFEGWQMYTAGFCEILEKACLRYHKYPTEENRIAKLTQNRAFDFKNMEEVDRSSGMQYPMRRLKLPFDCALAKKILWEWNCGKKDAPQWKPFCANVINFLEEEHLLDSRSTVDLKIKFPELNFSVDLYDMCQINNKTKRKRQIQRNKLQLPYPVAEKIPEKSGAVTLKSQKKTTSKPTYNYSKSTLVPQDIQAFAKAVTDIPDEDCSICITSLCDESGFHQAGGDKYCHVVELKQCQHIFHALCVKAAFDNSADKSLMCPYCKKIYGTKKGIQPPGRMDIRTVHQYLPGFHCPTISITYDIKSGIQSNEHPNPGQPYHAVGFPRQAYLPDNTEGRKILKLLKVAWDRKLIFTIGRSVTSGRDNCVTWNEIHHKTSMFSGGHGHGYPDPGYFTNVIEELKAQGVTEADI